MSPSTPAPLTPADITALLGDGWVCREESWRHIWTSRDRLFKQVQLNKHYLTVLVSEGEPGDIRQDVWKVPSPTKHRAVTVLTLAGLIPHIVFVVKPDNAEPSRREALVEGARLAAQIDAVRALHTESPAGFCPSCGRIGDISDTDDGLVAYPCPTLRALGVDR